MHLPLTLFIKQKTKSNRQELRLESREIFADYFKSAQIQWSEVDKNAEPLPQWPNGYVGSLSHKGQWIVALLGKKSDFKSIGVDLERVDAFIGKERMISKIYTQEEKDRYGQDPRTIAQIFSAKEAIYKAWYETERSYVGFLDAKCVKIESKEDVIFSELKGTKEVPKCFQKMTFKVKQEKFFEVTVFTFDQFYLSIASERFG